VNNFWKNTVYNGGFHVEFMGIMQYNEFVFGKTLTIVRADRISDARERSDEVAHLT